MTPIPTPGLRRPFPLALALARALLLCGLALTGGIAQAAAPRTADYIVAVVNRELVTNAEVEQRMERIEQDAKRSGARLPPHDELRKQIVDGLIEERAQLSYAKDVGIKVDESELDRAVASVAANNQVTMDELRARLRKDNVSYERFRSNLRDQMMLERVREREVQSKVKVTDAEIDAWLAKQRSAGTAPAQYNIAQILIATPDGATMVQTAVLLARAQEALKRAQAGESFDALVREYSNGPKDHGGEMGLRPADRLPDLFVEAVRNLKPGEMAQQVLRSGAGFHVLKLVDKSEADAM
ncbi:MAG TPA: SurA N-terminal domain-containing protein, partial [Methylibium sp.]